MATVLESALEFVNRGFYVFPTNQKRPVLKDWPTLASNDSATVTNWYEDEFKWVDGFGVCPKDTCFIIDVDVKDGKDGINSLKYLINELGLPRNTLIIRTKSGGLHLYYKYPELPEGAHIKSVANWKLPNGVVLDGIDIRGNKGQCIGPSESNNYSIQNDAPLIDAPPSIISYLPIDKTGGVKFESGTAGLIDEKAASGIKGVIPDVIEEGSRHETLLSLTASWARKVPYETAQVLLAEAIKRCEGDDISVEDYQERLDDAYAKFRPVIEDKLQWMLDNLVLVNQGNRIFDLSLPPNSATLKVEEARLKYKNWVVYTESEAANGDVKVKAEPALDKWMAHPDRQDAANIGYKPTDSSIFVDGISGMEYVNSYRKPEIPVVDDITYTDDDVRPFLDLVGFLWEGNADTMLDICAHLIQRPWFKMHWCPLLITPQEGMGKNVFFKCLSAAIGRWNAGTVNASQFNKSFNTFLIQNLVTVISEVQEVNKKERQVMMGKLKNYITESEQPIEGKGNDIYVTEIFTNFIIFSNIIDALYIEDTSRRFFIHVNHMTPRSPTFYKSVVDWIDSDDGQIALYNWLNQRNIEGFEPVGYAPMTDSRDEVIHANISDTELAVMEDIANQNSIFASDIVTRDSWEFYVDHVLHKGSRMSTAHEKHIKSRLFKGIQYTAPSGSRSSKQVRLPGINPSSDGELILKGNISKKTTMWTCRNHEKWEDSSPALYQEEFEKIFDGGKNSSVALINQ